MVPAHLLYGDDMSEKANNVVMVCEKHAPKPSDKYKDADLKSFVGGFVKVGFKAKNPLTGSPSLEHMWVEVFNVKNGKLGGKLNNIPVFETKNPRTKKPLKLGDFVLVKLSQVEDVIWPDIVLHMRKSRRETKH